MRRQQADQFGPRIAGRPENGDGLGHGRPLWLTPGVMGDGAAIGKGVLCPPVGQGRKGLFLLG
jgi:hypothetical protein